MAWQVIEYLDNNPNSTPAEVIGYFANELGADEQIKHLKTEIEKVQEIREVLRPLYGKKMNAESNIALFDSNFDMEVMMKYPPRQGSEKERKQYKQELQAGDEDYTALKNLLDSTKEEIEKHELEMSDVQQKAKNARRILETFNSYMQFILNYSNQSVSYSYETKTPVTSNNSNVF